MTILGIYLLGVYITILMHGLLFETNSFRNYAFEIIATLPNKYKFLQFMKKFPFKINIAIFICLFGIFSWLGLLLTFSLLLDIKNNC